MYLKGIEGELHMGGGTGHTEIHMRLGKLAELLHSGNWKEQSLALIAMNHLYKRFGAIPGSFITYTSTKERVRIYAEKVVDAAINVLKRVRRKTADEYNPWEHMRTAWSALFLYGDTGDCAKIQPESWADQATVICGECYFRDWLGYIPYGLDALLSPAVENTALDVITDPQILVNSGKRLGETLRLSRETLAFAMEGNEEATTRIMEWIKVRKEWAVNEHNEPYMVELCLAAMGNTTEHNPVLRVLERVLGRPSLSPEKRIEALFAIGALAESGVDVEVVKGSVRRDAEKGSGDVREEARRTMEKIGRMKARGSKAPEKGPGCRKDTTQRLYRFHK